MACWKHLFKVTNVYPKSALQNYNLGLPCCINLCRYHQTEEREDESRPQTEFKVLELRKFPSKTFTERSKIPQSYCLPPRNLKQKVTQDWGNVWPTARTFHPASVPLSVRMGIPPYRKGKLHPAPDKWGNAELMKIPNFLHLTPPVIKRQCAALNRFCTAWPEGLKTEEEMQKHFPVTIKKSTYLHSSITIRDEAARIVTMQVPLKFLSIDRHGRDKILRLLGDAYDTERDDITLVADRCPLSSQNEEYLQYLLTVIFKEAMKTEPWEEEKELSDNEEFVWEGSTSQEAMNRVISAKEEETTEQQIIELKESVLAVFHDGENSLSVNEYGRCVLELYGITSAPPNVARSSPIDSDSGNIQHIENVASNA